jgi:thymidine kinase
MSKLEIITGCMFSGKSTELINRIQKALILKKQIIIINHICDQRYDTNMISTHDFKKINSISLNNLSDIFDHNDYKNSEIIFIDEAQFFNDLKDSVLKIVEFDNKWVVVCGLHSDYQRNKFGQIIDLLPYCDTFIKQTALCIKCCDGTPASFSKRIIDNDSLILVDGELSYIPVCRKHYNSFK